MKFKMEEADYVLEELRCKKCKLRSYLKKRFGVGMQERMNMIFSFLFFFIF
jgi:hypothetical protein